LKNKKKRICIFTGSRADYGILSGFIKELQNNKSIYLDVIVAGSHLSKKYGHTIDEIKTDKVKVTKQISTLNRQNSSFGVSKSVSITQLEMARFFDARKPDLLVVLGDRYETFAASSAALIANIPIAHFHGGELTEGAFDNSMRHAITKFSSIHLTSLEEYSKRIIQMGEDPSTVFCVGSLSLNNLKQMKLFSKSYVNNLLNFKNNHNYVMVSFHPETIGNKSKKIFKNLLTSLGSLKKINIIFTKANADPESQLINLMIDEFVRKNNINSRSFISMGKKLYFSTMKYSLMLIGNSSSGIIEAPSLNLPTINIGTRQKGRVRPESVIDSKDDVKSISKTINVVLDNRRKNMYKNVNNPYYKNQTIRKSINVLFKNLEKIDLQKKFYDQF
jgi:GDP/UDP-N,N'-diacetylbacillosamine 2-epimerase (hydrolysing)